MVERSHIETLSDRAFRHQQAARGGLPDGSDGPDRLIAARYRLCARLGRGRLGEIYEAVDEESAALGIERRVAVQLIDEGIAADRGFLDELRRGYAALRAGPHPNIVTIVDFGRAGNVSFLVMELLEGASLRFVLDDAAALSMDETAPVIRAVGDALQYLHAKDIVYGNLKPEQVFITYDYAVKLLDIVPSNRPSPVPYYVEDRDPDSRQARDPRDDVYGLACLTYELLTGMHPFNANSPIEAQRAGLEPRPIEQLAPRQWEALARGLAFERARRTPTIAELLGGLGIVGTERLRATAGDAEQPARAPAHDSVATRDQAPARRPQPVRRPATDEDLWQPPRRVAAPARQRTARPLLLLAVAVGLGATVLLNYERLRTGAVDLFAGVDARLDSEPGAVPGSGDVIQERPAGVDVALSPAGPASAPDPVTPTDAAAPTEEVTPVAVVGTETPVAVAGTETPAAVTAPAQAPPAAVAAAPPPVQRPADTAPEAAAKAQPAYAAAAGRPPEPQFGFAAPFLRVDESAAAVEIVIRRGGDVSAPASVDWWLSGDSALSDEDFADLGQSTETFSPGEETRTLHVPLVRDAIAEPVESFYVYLGRYDAERRHLDAASSLRVDVTDDD